MKVCLVSIRNGLKWPRSVSCIQDAFFSLTKRWLQDRKVRIIPSFYNVSWGNLRPARDLKAVAEADVVFIYSSNEFIYHGNNDSINPMFVQGSNDKIADLIPALRGKTAVLMTMDAHDSGSLIFGNALIGAGFKSTHVISENNFPISVQTLRFNQLRSLGLPFQQRRGYDFIYWGTTKRQTPDGNKSGDPRFEFVKSALTNDRIIGYLFGNHFGKAKADSKFNTDLSQIAPTLMLGRTTCCFQWPGFSTYITARYIEALALGILPFVHQDYDKRLRVARSDQVVHSPDELCERIIDTADDGGQLYNAALRKYLSIAPSDDDQYQVFSDKLREILK